MDYGFGGKFVYFVYLVNILWKWYEMLPNCVVMILISDEYENVDIDLKIRSWNEGYDIMWERWLVMLYCVIVIIVVVGLLLIVLAELNSRGCYVYRGDAAQIFVEKCWFKI